MNGRTAPGFRSTRTRKTVTATNPAYRCCTSSGAVAALDARTGAELWYHRVIPEPPLEVGANARGTPIFAPSGAPVWCSPSVDEKRGLLYIGTGQNYTRPSTSTSDAILALDLDTGMRKWLFQATADDAYNLACVAETQKENCSDPMGPDVDFGMAPILVQRPDGREILVVGQKSGVVFALDPDQGGKVLWSRRVGRGGLLGGIHWGMATDGRRVYVANSDNPLGFAPEIEPEAAEAPGIYALDLTRGRVVWKHPSPVDTI